MNSETPEPENGVSPISYIIMGCIVAYFLYFVLTFFVLEQYQSSLSPFWALLLPPVVVTAFAIMRESVIEDLVKIVLLSLVAYVMYWLELLPHTAFMAVMMGSLISPQE